MKHPISLHIRAYRSDDAAATMDVFRRAVTETSSCDYDDEQVRTWAGNTGTPTQWNTRRSAARTWVAETADHRPSIVGFIDIDDTGYIDMLFVDPSIARRGVASQLLDQVERYAAANDIARLSVHASITAQPFFHRHGFRAVETRHPQIGDVTFVNYLMIKPMPV
ncbi:GCN5-related N-acetyltransferase [Bifidobacterium ramosum]|uniref:GCN5-related N-acetyltransferase n=1 Tax=Bifidobacterium ramosum TaxID=1798158 RepID=A0A6L4X040_9BIFI|nr:GNAT family N-acetyltransferase [Bifidobacterium ramosum]KAB8287465.1 GCN5-related N-acetyltransferase [Bifidobacterium ramosum]NEG72185.1 GNAT family N-acetyltransferase [Bifidobacterium ramosum]